MNKNNNKQELTKEEIKFVYNKLQERELHPQGEFDKAGRFYLDDGDLVNVRTPSRAFPYSQMVAGRTLKFVKAMAEKYEIKTLEELINRFNSNGSSCNNMLIKEFQQEQEEQQEIKEINKKIAKIEKEYKECIENNSLEINKDGCGNFSLRLEQVEVYNTFRPEHLLKENYKSTKEEMKEAILMRLDEEGFNLSDFENFEELEEALYETGYLDKLNFEEEVREIELSVQELKDIKVKEIGELFDKGLTPEEVEEQTEAYKVYQEALEELKEEWKQELDYKNINTLKP